MPAIREPKAIFDRTAVKKALRETLPDSDAALTRLRPHALAVIRAACQSGIAEIRARFEASNDGATNVQENSFLMDQLITLLFDYAIDYRRKAPALTLVATGGYGRQELSPHSDIDLLFLCHPSARKAGGVVAEFILYLLWDLGFKTGHTVADIGEMLELAKTDISTRTTLLDARKLTGDAMLYKAFGKLFSASIAHNAPEFIEAKLAEQDARHAKVGDSRYVVEPNIKEGKGALRDLHTLYWIAKYTYGGMEGMVKHERLTPEEYKLFVEARGFLWTVRGHLHYVAGRAEERLTFDVQLAVAKRMGYRDRTGMQGVERFMKHYFTTAKQVGDLTRIFCAVLEEENKRTPLTRMPRFFLRKKLLEGFPIDGHRLALESEAQLRADPVSFIRFFYVAVQNGLDVHPKALQMMQRNLRFVDARLRVNPDANALFMDILVRSKKPATILRKMSEAGVLGKFIPDFGRVVAMMQYNMYHVHTVDEHTLTAISILNDIEQGKLKDSLPIASEMIHKITDRDVLYFALFLHDIAKGRGGDHSELGAEVAHKLGPRMGLSPSATETVAWLVLHHLLLSDTAFRRDLEDPATIAAFVAKVQSPERLRLLLVLTVADIMAVSPTTWNGWKGALMRTLYAKSEELMVGGNTDRERTARIAHLQEQLREKLHSWTGGEISEYFEQGYAAFWLSFNLTTHQRIATLVRKAVKRRNPLEVSAKVDRFRAITRVIFVLPDEPGLFSKISGALAVAGANIVNAKVFTLKNGLAVDCFWIQTPQGKAFDDPKRIDAIREVLSQALAGKIQLSEQIARKSTPYPKRTEVFTVAPRVVIDNALSDNYTVIEVQGRDRVGFLYRVTNAIAELKLSIGSAHISTFGERAIDVFYVKDRFGMKIDKDSQLALIHDRLLEALSTPPPAGGRPGGGRG
ncbi:MAG: [protein-PII] uridylyltransferase [Alphaproteobacteria bacterium]|nr:[protein-PII] uridylyltransferase [Alphaproteobacteria bacterium]